MNGSTMTELPRTSGDSSPGPTTPASPPCCPTVPHNTVALRVGVEGERLLLGVGAPR